ncbi:MAG: NADH-quinone oxidoreductase subunit A [Dehalococcoidia bacterium]|nr:NADH-quinone oxidoreductase subunit A [Dehalococcoidia bacterium]MYA52006.1 NADH-quinone oxidoreductase subunit A [Dehalococcoidia bacterium]
MYHRPRVATTERPARLAAPTPRAYLCGANHKGLGGGPGGRCCASRGAPALDDGESEAMSFYDTWSAVFIASIVGFILVFSALVGARLLGPFARERGKGVSYECGMLPIGRNWAQVHVRYYIFAIMFLIFDVETIFIFPWAVIFLNQGIPDVVFWYMFVFIVVLSLGLVYAWRRGVLEWK